MNKQIVSVLLLVAFAVISSISYARGGGGHAGHSGSGGHSGSHGGGNHTYHVVSPHIATPKYVSAPKSTVHVKQYVKPSTNAVVKPHDRTAPNNTQKDNWTSKPNTNPETGKPGIKTPAK